MKYKNKHTGTIVEPSNELTAQAFSQEPWEEYVEPIIELDNENEDETGGEEECSQPEQTPTSQENTQTSTSPADTEAPAKTASAGKKPQTRTKKSS